MSHVPAIGNSTAVNSSPVNSIALPHASTKQASVKRASYKHAAEGSKIVPLFAVKQNKDSSFWRSVTKIGMYIVDFFRWLFCCKPKKEQPQLNNQSQLGSKEDSKISATPLEIASEAKIPNQEKINEPLQREDEAQNNEIAKDQDLNTNPPIFFKKEARTDLQAGKSWNAPSSTQAPSSAKKNEEPAVATAKLAESILQNKAGLKITSSMAASSVAANSGTLDSLKNGKEDTSSATSEGTAKKPSASVERNKEPQKKTEPAKSKLETKEEVVEGPSYIKRDTRILTSVIAKLERGFLIEEGGLPELVTELEWLVPYDKIPKNLDALLAADESASGFQEKIASQQKLLATALKTYKIMLESQKKADSKQEGDVVALKSQLCRYSDLLAAKRNPAKRPEYPIFLNLDEKQDASSWPKLGAPMKEVPDYLFKFARAVDSGENDYMLSAVLGAIFGGWKKDLNKQYFVTMRYVQDEVLKTPLETLSASQLEALFFTLYRKMMGIHANVPIEDLLRKEEIMVLANPEIRDAGTFEKIANVVEKTDDSSARAIREIKRLTNRWSEFNRAKQVFKERHWKALESISTIPPAGFDKIPAHMKMFFALLEKHLKNPKLHPFQVASFIIFGLSSIHPFTDGTGRMERMLMNILYMQKGLHPFIILKEQEFNKLFASSDFARDCCKYLQDANEKIAVHIKNGELTV